MNLEWRPTLLHLSIVVALFSLYQFLPEYHSGNLARILVLCVYAMGFNILFGYTGLLSLGHALFFSAGMYGLGLSIQFFGFSPIPAMLAGLLTALVFSVVIGFLALRTTGVAFMIVTLMFAQAGYLTILAAGTYTRGDEGFVIQQSERILFGIDLTAPDNRYYFAVILFSICFLLLLLGYDVQRYKLIAIVLSGVLAGCSGAAYALLFGYAGATFATVQYSILPLLWVLVGGAGTTIGPLIGTVFMFYLIDYASEFTSAYMLIAGVVLIIVTLFAPQGLAGVLRKRLMPWLP